MAHTYAMQLGNMYVELVVVDLSGAVCAKVKANNMDMQSRQICMAVPAASFNN
jgi:hypothetical protein